ncbi:hypothetical protein AB0C10_21345 [Microbispora amethystogenes]|uniref:hypothetical protein n=1 Tax=Microbispora amethystogenes TaxID=1427754 RepID=UPI0033F28B4E
MPSIRVARSMSYAAADDQPTLTNPGGQAGDLVLVFHSCDEGPLSEMGISGGGNWATIGQRSNDDPLGNGGGTKVYAKPYGSSEPSAWQLTQDRNPLRLADTTITVVIVRGGSANGIVVAQAGDSGYPPFFYLSEIYTPAAAPSTGSSLELRYAAGFRLPSTAAVTWTTPTGYTPVANATVQSRDFIASTVASRTLVSSTPVGEATFGASVNVYGGHGFTVIVPGTDGGGTAPPPPSFPSFTPAKGSGLYRYTAHDLLTGAYLADIYPTNVSFDRRIGEPGMFSGVLAIPNRRVADQVARIIPRYGYDLSSGPGRIAVHVWRAGVLWGVYWIHGALPSKSRRGGITIQLRGSTLEAFLDNVPVETDLLFQADQIDNARSLIGDMLALEGANIGLTLQDGTSGVARDLVVKADDNPTYGGALRAYAQATGGFEYVIDPRVVGGITQRLWRWGYPAILGDKTHVFTESPSGGDILDWGEEIDALRGATRIRVRGGTPEVEDSAEGSKPAVSDWTDAAEHLAAGWPRYGRVIDHPAESVYTEDLNGYAQRWIATLPGAVRIYSATVALGAKPSISPSSLGDQVRRVQINEWWPRTSDGAAGFDASQRLIGIGITPVARGTGREEAQLILEEAVV